jgi:hypothetical protein
MKVIFEKINSSFTKMKSYLDVHLRVAHVFPNARKDVQFLGPFFSKLHVIVGLTLTSLERRLLGRSGIVGLKI